MWLNRYDEFWKGPLVIRTIQILNFGQYLRQAHSRKEASPLSFSRYIFLDLNATAKKMIEIKWKEKSYSYGKHISDISATPEIGSQVAILFGVDTDKSLLGTMINTR